MKIGLVLAGGIAKGAYQFGFCRALSTFFPVKDITAVSASSIGIWNSLGLQTGQMDVGEEMWTGLNTVGLRSFYNKFIKGGLLREYAARLAQGAAGFDRDLYGVCCESPGMALNYINLRNTAPGTLSSWLRAFVSIPVLFRPVSIGGRQYFDGGTADNVPLAPLASHDLDIVFAMHFDPSHKLDFEKIGAKSAVELVYTDKGFLKGSFDFSEDTVRSRIQQGYDTACETIEQCLSEQDPERIAALTGRQKPAPFRWTFDSVLNRFNSVMRRVIVRTDGDGCDQIG